MGTFSFNMGRISLSHRCFFPAQENLFRIRPALKVPERTPSDQFPGIDRAQNHNTGFNAILFSSYEDKVYA